MPETRMQLSDSDALIWRIEGDPVLRSPIVVVGLLDHPPVPTRLRPALERAVDAVPRLRQRLDAGGSPWARPRWVEDPDFSLDHHVRHVRAATSNGVRAVLDLAEPDVTSAFDPARPLWQLTLVEGLEGGQAAFVLRFHHTVSDGVGAVALARHIFDADRRGRRRPTIVAAPATDDRPGRSSLHRLVGNAARAADMSLRAALDPAGTARSGLRVARSVRRMLEPASEPLSPILRGRSLNRRLHVVEVPLGALRDVARATGGTLNDVFLAAVAGGLREYHDRSDAPVDAIRITMPINLRSADDEPGGNHFTPARFVLPIDDPDPRQRIELAGAIVRRWRREPAVGLTPILATALGLLPAPVVQRAFAGMLRAIDVDAVDVPGLMEPAFLAGARVDRLWAFSPPTGAAMSITLISHLDTGCIGIEADLAAVSDPDLLARCIEGALDEVLALVHHGAMAEVPA